MQKDDMTHINKIKFQQDRQRTHNATLRGFRETIAEWKLQ